MRSIDVLHSSVRNTTSGLNDFNIWSNHIDHCVIVIADVVDPWKVLPTLVRRVACRRRDIGAISRHKYNGREGFRRPWSQPSDRSNVNVVAREARCPVVVGHNDVRKIGVTSVGHLIGEGHILCPVDVLHASVSSTTSGLDELHAWIPDNLLDQAGINRQVLRT